MLTARAGEGVLEAAETLVGEIHRLGVRVELDERMDISLGRRIVDHELRGVPLRIELGPRELADGHAVLARRIRSSKETFALGDLAEQVPQILDEDQRELLEQATACRDRRVGAVQTLTDAIQIAGDGFARVPWRACGPDAEDQMARSGVSVRCLLRPDGQPVIDPNDDAVEALLARAY